MVKKEQYISFIIDQLRSGQVNRSNVMATFGKKWQTGVRSFDRYWKTANEQYYKQLQTIQKVKEEQSMKEEKKAIKMAISSKQEAQVVLTEIIRNEENKNQDRIKAIDTLSKQEGWNAPTRTAETDSKGNDKLTAIEITVIKPENEV